MRTQHFGNQAREMAREMGLLEHNEPWSAQSVENGSVNVLAGLAATLLTIRGGDIGKLSRMMSETARELVLSPEQFRRMGLSCLLLRVGEMAHDQSAARGAFASGADDRSLSLLLRKASPLTAEDQRRVWARCVSKRDATGVIKLLSSHGLSSKAMGPDLKSALSEASETSYVSVVALLSVGACPNGEPGESKSPLLRAFEVASGPAIKALLEAGADWEGSRLPKDLTKRVGANAARWSRAPASERLDPVMALARALEEQAALSEAAAPGLTGGRGPRL